VSASTAQGFCHAQQGSKGENKVGTHYDYMKPLWKGGLKERKKKLVLGKESVVVALNSSVKGRG
jgi:hypothetical protein